MDFSIVAFIIALIIFMVFVIIMKGAGKKNTAVNLLEEGGYVAKPFMTERERDFYIRLHAVLPKGDFLMSQVRLVDIVSVSQRFKADKGKKMTLFRKISQWHCDYVWLDHQFSIKAVIELDDSSHRRKDRIARDEFFNEVVRQAGYSLVRLETKKDVDVFLNNKIHQVKLL